MLTRAKKRYILRIGIWKPQVYKDARIMDMELSPLLQRILGNNHFHFFEGSFSK